MKEIFKIIQDFPNYEVSNTGKIRNIKRNTFLQPRALTNGLLQVTLCNNGIVKFKLISRVVAETFINTELSNTNIVYHIDGNKENNAVSNLQIWENTNLLKQYLLTTGITTNPAYLK